MLVSANILRYAYTVGNEKDSNGRVVVSITAVLAHSQLSQGGIPQYALFDNCYWYRVKVCKPNIV